MSKYKFFLSFASDDNTRGHVRKFFDILDERVARLSGLGAKVHSGYFSDTAIEPGDPWPKHLADAIHTSDVLICLLSPSYFAREWCGRELAAFRKIAARQSSESHVRVIPILWQGSNSLSNLANHMYEAFPGINYEDFHTVKGISATAVEHGLAHHAGIGSHKNQLTIMSYALADRINSLCRQLPKFEQIDEFDLLSIESEPPFPNSLVGPQPTSDAQPAPSNVAGAPPPLNGLPAVVTSESERSTLPSDTDSASPTTIPPHNPQFVGRAREMNWLHDQLFQQKVGVVAAVQGLGGVGKSALAFEYAHAFASDYPGGRFLVPCEGIEDVKLPLASMAGQFGVELSEAEKRDIDLAYLHICTALRTRKRSLLVLDNVDRPSLLLPARVNLLPSPDHVHFLATTRLAIAPTEKIATFPLDPLIEDDAVALLKTHRSFANDADREAARSIVRLLGGYAIAVEVVAVFLREHPEICYAAYLGRLEKEQIGAVEGAASDPDVHLSRHLETHLADLLAPTLESLSDPERLAVDYAAMLPPDQVALPWLKALVAIRHAEMVIDPSGAYPDPWLQAQNRLLRLRLLVPSDEPTVARMHRLVGEVVRRACADTSALRTGIVNLATARGKFLFDGGWVDRANRWEIAPLRSLSWQEMDAGALEGASLANLAHGPERELGNLVAARSLMQRAIAIQEQQCGSDDPDLAISYSNLATVEQDLGNLDEARSLLLKAIQIREKVFGGTDPVLAKSYSSLGLVEVDGENLGEAQSLLQRAIAIWETTSGPGHIFLAPGYSNLAIVEQKLGNLVEARSLLQRAIAIEEPVLGAEHPTLAKRYSNLAMVEQALGNLDAARSLMERAIGIEEGVFEADQPDLAIRYWILGTIEYQASNSDSARALFRRAYPILLARFGSQHPLTQRLMTWLARVGDELSK